MKRHIASAFAGLLLAGCAGTVPWNDQNKAGLTVAEVTWCETAESADKYLCGTTVEEAISGDIGKAAPGLVEAVIEAVLGLR